MANAAPAVQPPAKSSKKPLILALVLALAGAGGGFAVTYLGLLDAVLDSAEGGGDSHGAPAPGTQTPAGSTSFVALAPITVNLGARGDSRHLRFSAQLEVNPGYAAEVQRIMPRIMDVLNIYLRALEPHELEEPAALLRLRAQMLRRVRMVSGPGAVHDLLVIEFILN